VIATDILRQLSPIAAKRIQHLATSGSPLKKYNDFFNWGTEFFLASTTSGGRAAVAPVSHLPPWTNFLDRRDPVADPLAGSFWAYDPQGSPPQPVAITDVVVHNVEWSPPGGLSAHNYWDNQREWIRAMAYILDEVMHGRVPDVSTL
jgi:hypothetical protein